MKRIIPLCLIILIISCGGCYSRGVNSEVKVPEITQRIEMERGAVVMLVEPDMDGNLGSYCSGVWIDSERILTAYHCIGNTDVEGELLLKEDEVGKSVQVSYRQDYVEVEGKEGEIKESHPGEVIKVDMRSDLAIIRVSGGYHLHNYAMVGMGEIFDGDTVTVIGHPIGFSYVWLPGTVVHSIYLKGPHGFLVKLLHITSSAYFGNSGGPLFNDRGELIGICSFLVRGPQMTFFIHRDVIVKFLK